MRGPGRLRRCADQHAPAQARIVPRTGACRSLGTAGQVVRCTDCRPGRIHVGRLRVPVSALRDGPGRLCPGSLFAVRRLPQVLPRQISGRLVLVGMDRGAARPRRSPRRAGSTGRARPATAGAGHRYRATRHDMTARPGKRSRKEVPSAGPAPSDGIGPGQFAHRTTPARLVEDRPRIGIPDPVGAPDGRSGVAGRAPFPVRPASRSGFRGCRPAIAGIVHRGPRR